MSNNESEPIKILSALSSVVSSELTSADCKFTHPASRPIRLAGKAAVRGRPTRPAAPVEGIAGGMTPSRKFAAPVVESKLNPAAGEFKPAGEAEKEIDVSM